MSSEGLLLGFDVGSSSIKAALLDAATGRLVAAATSPESELEIAAPKPGWAEQDPDTWWRHVVRSALSLREEAGKRWADVRAIGIAYQMHGLVLLDGELEPLRPAIIWCDSRAAALGEQENEPGCEQCVPHAVLKVSPGIRRVNGARASRSAGQP